MNSYDIYTRVSDEDGRSGPSFGSPDEQEAVCRAWIERRPGLEPVKVEDRRLARFLEEQRRLVQVGDGDAISSTAHEQAKGILV